MEDDIEATAKKIDEVVRDHWNREQKAVQLSALGQAVPGYREFGLSLSKFIQAYVSDRLKVIAHPHLDGVLAVIPMSAEIPSDIQMLFANRESGSASETAFPSHKRFSRDFWLAFARPLHDARRRWILLRQSEEDEIDGYSIGEGTTGVVIPDGAVEIPSSYTAGTDILPVPLHIQRVHGCIDKWLQENHLSDAPFLDSGGKIHIESRTLAGRVSAVYNNRRVGASTSFEPNAGVSDLRRLAHALDVIEQSDQSRIMVPLDILAKILRRLM